MKKPIIGILGGSGNIGSKCIDILGEEYQIYATFMSNKKEDLEYCKYIQMDINDLNKLSKFCKQIDVLINCAGASYKNGEKIAKIASQYNIPYIDPSGESFLEEKLEYEFNNIFVLSAGYFPGLSGIMANYACSNLKTVDFLEGFNISEEIPSISAVEDFVLTNLSGFGKSLYCYKDNEYVHDDSFKYENINGKFYKLSNYITREFVRIAEKFGVKKANWFNQIYEEEVIRKMQEIVLKSDTFNLNYKNDIESIISLFEKNTSEKKFNRLKVSASNTTERIEIEIESEDSSTMSAIICANTVKEIFRKKYKKGLYYSMDILDFKNIEKDLKTKNIRVYEKKEEKEYDEGVI